MSVAAAQASAFYREVAEHGVLWTMQSSEGIPLVKNGAGQDVIGFWSLKSRVQKVIDTVPKYSNDVPVEISWDDFVKGMGADMRKKGVLVGVNWSGKGMQGYDIEVERLIANVQAQPEYQPKPRTWWERTFKRGT
jgi:hypothetical protein